MEERTFPKVLIGCPTSSLHDYIIEEFLLAISRFTYPNFDLILFDNSDGDEFFNKLNELKKNYPINCIIKKQIPKKNIFETLADGYNLVIEEMLANGYDYLLMTSTDVLPPEFTIDRLMAHDKDLVGFLVHGGLGCATFPVVLKDGSLVASGKRGLHYYTWDEVNKFTDLTKVWATSAACLLIKRKVLEAGVRYRFSPQFNMGEDLWFFIEANSAGFEFWLDPLRIIHKNRDWKRELNEGISDRQKRIAKNISIKELASRMCRMELMMASLIRRLKEAKVIG